MNKLKIAGIIISIVAAVAFVFLYFRKPHTLVGAILALIAGAVVAFGMIMVAASEELNLEDTKDEMTACGILTFLVGAAGVEAKGQAGYVALGIAAVGLAIAGAGIILNKLKERETFDNHTLSH